MCRLLFLPLLMLSACSPGPSASGLPEFAEQAARYPAPDSTLRYLSGADPEFYGYALLSRGEIEEAEAVLRDYLAYWESSNVLAPTPAAPLVEDVEVAQAVIRLRWLLDGEASALGYHARLSPAVRTNDFVRTSVCSVQHQTYAEYADAMWVSAFGGLARGDAETPETRARQEAFRECVFDQGV